MTISLIWQGPFTLAELQTAHIHAKRIPGVYLLIQEHEIPIPSVYVGSSNDLASRIKTHIQNTLSLAYYIRTANGQWYPDEDPETHFWKQIPNLHQATGTALKALEKTNFAWAEVSPDRCVSAERLIYQQLHQAQNEKRLLLNNGAPVARKQGQLSVEELHNSGSPSVLDLIGSIIFAGSAE